MTKLLTVGEVAEIMRVSKPTAYNVIHSKGFPYVKIGRAIRVPEEALHKWLLKQSQAPKC